MNRKLDLSPELRLEIRPFQPADQEAVRGLVLAGLEDHWGSLDLSLNPDLNDIAAAYAPGTFLVGRLAGEIAACGAFLPRGAHRAQIVRMSVRRENRGQGLGGQMLQVLIAAARTRGICEVTLETTETWNEVIAFYQKHGFVITHHAGGDVYFKLNV